MAIRTVQTKPFNDQRPGTSGLRKKTRVFMEPNYLENFVQSVFNALSESWDGDFSDKTIVLGGDGRYFNRKALQKIISIAAGNKFGRVLVGAGGVVSTPAVSAIIRKHSAFGGFVLSASHNPGGIDEDFGLKYNVSNGGPAPAQLTERIFTLSQSIESYSISDSPEIELDNQGKFRVEQTELHVIDPLKDYTELMQECFDFDSLKALFASGFRIAFDAMHAATGPYAVHILEKTLGAPAGSVLNQVPLEDFGGGHPDPNQVHAAELISIMNGPNPPELGAASDGDGDRNLILGPNFYVSPCDSLAIITEYAFKSIPGYQGKVTGVARSMPTSQAADRVAEALGIECFETPTGWKFFGSLLDAGRVTICGEESFGTGSNHVREKDGLWAVLCWLSILADTKKSIREVAEDHWARYGRSYYQRHDYEGLPKKEAEEMFSELRSSLARLKGTSFAGRMIEEADDFSYEDPIDNSKVENQGVRIILKDRSRVVCRLSGTGTEGATLRIYLEQFERENISSEPAEILGPLARAIRNQLRLKDRFGDDRPTVVT